MVTLMACAGAAVAAGTARSQTGCGTALAPGDALKVRNLVEAGGYDLEGLPASSSVVPVTVHIVRRSDGVTAMTQARVDQALADANAIWSSHGIEFCQHGYTRYIDNDFYYYDIVSEAEADMLRLEDVVDNTINVYFTRNLPWCGISSFSWSAVQGIVMANACTGTDDNPSSFAHELGHYLDLLHTHETATGVECTDGSNCETAGDLLCDTPADPRLNQAGFVTPPCEYMASVDPPCEGDPAYDPDTRNLMSYSRKECRTDLTVGQGGRALGALLNQRPELLEFVGCDHGGACSPGAGSCFVAGGSPGCDRGDCCATVCAADPFCCTVEWDNVCVEEAVELCGECGAPAAGNCYASNGTRGCQSEDCCALVCFDDPYCCDVEWDSQCVQEAIERCSPCGGLETGDCDAIHASPGCNDAACCAEVCAIEPSCCDLGWGPVCVGLAIELGCSDPGPGDECATAIPVGEGSVVDITLSDNTGSTGDDSSCAAGDAVDEWYRYVPFFNDTATTEICTEFSEVDIVLSVFDGCLSEELACAADAPGCPFGSDLNATVSWPAEAGVPYLVRVSAVGATPTNNFIGSLVIDCEPGCGDPDAGNCFEENGSPYCDDQECCLTVCAVDAFCCATTWDELCADEAIELCAGCGPEAGPCLDVHPSTGCTDPECCAIVCSLDPYCCEVEWDWLCVNEAIECTVIAFDHPHLALGEAIVSVGPLGHVILEGLGGPEDGVEMLPALPADGGVHGVELMTTAINEGQGVKLMEIYGSTPVTTTLETPLARVGSIPADGQQYLLGGDFPAFGPQTVRLRIYDGSELRFEQINCTSAVYASHEAYGLGLRRTAGQDVSLVMRLEQQSAVMVIGDCGSPAPIMGDLIVMTSEIGQAPEDPLGDDLAGGVITRVRLYVDGTDSLEITDEPVIGCIGDTDGNLAVDVDDLLNVILRWETADFAADVDDSGMVNVDDLITVILAWGPCQPE
jgi:hypothetical protein